MEYPNNTLNFLNNEHYESRITDRIVIHELFIIKIPIELKLIGRLGIIRGDI